VILIKADYMVTDHPECPAQLHSASHPFMLQGYVHLREDKPYFIPCVHSLCK